MRLYIPIRKIEEGSRLIYGIAAAEEVDRMNEIFDYASSKPYVQKWSAEQAEQSGGKNYGNVRAMHNDISAGMVVKPIYFDDTRKTVQVCAKIVDDVEWKKVLEGVYPGLSFGGHIVKSWPDNDTGAMRYTLRPCELSLADRPCVPSAGIIEVVKTDGSIRKMQLKGSKKMDEKTVQKMDITEFGKLINDVNAGLSEDENAPQPLKDAVANLVQVLGSCTEEEKTDPPDPEGNDTKKEPVPPAPPAAKGSGCDPEETEKACTPKDVEKIVSASIEKAMAPMAEAIKKIAEGKTMQSELEKRLAKVEKAAAPSKVVLKTDGIRLKKSEQMNPSNDALDKIKQIHHDQNSWAY